MKIESNIPMPSNVWTSEGEGRTGRPSKYPWGDMQVGDSLFFEGESSTAGSKPYMSSVMHGRNHGVKFTARKVEGGIRIWRIE